MPIDWVNIFGKPWPDYEEKANVIAAEVAASFAQRANIIRISDDLDQKGV